MPGSRFDFRFFLFALALAPLILADSAFADRPKIGLVLAGGGARGASHVGVLKVLERERIPIDYVAGTSMGSIVGGMYASGMPPEEIERQMVAVDWEGVFQDKVDRQDRSYRRKMDDRLWLYDAKPGFSGGKIKLPPGLVQGQRIGLLLTSLTLPVGDIDDFDNLPIPFRAIAADIQTGEKVVLDSGNIAKAIRASMAVPAALSPVPWDGRRLVDGGIASNLPVETVKEMGADIIIAVDLGQPLSDAELGESLLSIVDQLTAMLVRDNVERELAMLTDEDVLILPDLGDISSAEFDRVGEAIPTGVTAAELKIDELRQLSLSEEEYAAHVAARSKPRTEMPVIEFITFNNSTAVADDFLLGRLQTTMKNDQIVGQPLDPERMEQAINELYALDIFAHVAYDLVEEDGRYGVHVNAINKTWGPNYLQLGAKWNSSMNGSGILSVGLAYLKTEMNSWNAEWRTGVAIGEEPSFITDFYQPLGKGADWFVGGALLAQQFNTNVFEEGTNDVVEQVRIQRLAGSAYIGREFGNWGRTMLQLTRGGGERSIRIGDPTIPDEDFDIAEATIVFEVDRLDDLYFARHGHAAIAKYRYSDTTFGSSDDFEQVLINGRFVRTFGRNTVEVYGDYNSTISGIAPPERLFRVGGLFNLSGFEFNQLSGQNFAQIAAVYRRNAINLGPIKMDVGTSLEYGNVWQARSDMSFDDGLLGGSVFLGSKTPLGPLYLAYGISEGSDGTFYVSLGAVRNDPVLQ